jgi:hypothetical protein
MFEDNIIDELSYDQVVKVAKEIRDTHKKHTDSDITELFESIYNCEVIKEKKRMVAVKFTVEKYLNWFKLKIS